MRYLVAGNVLFGSASIDDLIECLLQQGSLPDVSLFLFPNASTVEYLIVVVGLDSLRQVEGLVVLNLVGSGDGVGSDVLDQAGEVTRGRIDSAFFYFRTKAIALNLTQRSDFVILGLVEVEAFVRGLDIVLRHLRIVGDDELEVGLCGHSIVFMKERRH